MKQDPSGRPPQSFKRHEEPETLSLLREGGDAGPARVVVLDLDEVNAGFRDLASIVPTVPAQARGGFLPESADPPAANVQNGCLRGGVGRRC